MIVHVLPCRDVVGHEVSDDCVCGPVTAPVTDDDTGSVIGFVVIHAALDKRLVTGFRTEETTMADGG